MRFVVVVFFFFFNDTATTEIYTLSLHDALPIFRQRGDGVQRRGRHRAGEQSGRQHAQRHDAGGGSEWGRHLLRERSEEHTSELQSRLHLVCRLLLEKKKQ